MTDTSEGDNQMTRDAAGRGDAVTDNDRMSKNEREELGRLLRQKARVAKAHVKLRKKDQMADFAEKIAAKYDPVDLGLETAYNEALETGRRMQDQINAGMDARLEELGVAKHFRGRGLTVVVMWEGRGENSTASRRVELLRVAQTAADAAEQRAIVAIDTKVLQLEELLTRSQLRSHEANRLLESFPTVESLLPPLDLTDVLRLAAASGARNNQQRADEIRRFGYSRIEPSLLASGDAEGGEAHA
jgi:hypothetical protein